MTQTLSDRDQSFFHAVYNLIKADYPEMEGKFGIWRAHEHFDLQEGEVFHETSNAETKESILRIIPKNKLPKNAFASSWKLTEHGPIVATWCCDDQPLP